jgi:hypothetical protein
MKMSWVTLDRICREEARADDICRMVESTGRPLRSSAGHLSDAELLEKLRGFGVDLDRAGLEKLCEGALSAEEVARPLQDRRGMGRDGQADWIWICLVSLWERWWPDKVCLELLDDKVQAGYAAAERSETSRCAAIWLDAWSDVLRLCDATGIGSVGEFDDRFPMTQSLYNWSQDLEDALWNAGLDDREMLLRPRRRAVTHPSQPARPARPNANRAPRRKREISAKYDHDPELQRQGLTVAEAGWPAADRLIACRRCPAVVSGRRPASPSRGRSVRRPLPRGCPPPVSALPTPASTSAISASGCLSRC